MVKTSFANILLWHSNPQFPKAPVSVPTREIHQQLLSTQARFFLRQQCLIWKCSLLGNSLLYQDVCDDSDSGCISKGAQCCITMTRCNRRKKRERTLVHSKSVQMCSGQQVSSVLDECGRMNWIVTGAPARPHALVMDSATRPQWIVQLHFVSMCVSVDALLRRLQLR